MKRRGFLKGLFAAPAGVVVGKMLTDEQKAGGIPLQMVVEKGNVTAVTSAMNWNDGDLFTAANYPGLYRYDLPASALDKSGEVFINIESQNGKLRRINE